MSPAGAHTGRLGGIFFLFFSSPRIREAVLNVVLDIVLEGMLNVVLEAMLNVMIERLLDIVL